MFILKVQKFVDNGGWSSDTVRTGLGKGVTVARLTSTLVIGKITLVVSRKREVGRCHCAVVCLFVLEKQSRKSLNIKEPGFKIRK